jgi:hypothetical protein
VSEITVEAPSVEKLNLDGAQILRSLYVTGTVVALGCLMRIGF